MRTTRVLAIIAILGIAFSFRASANVVYDSETTNEWFNANVKTSSQLTSPPWTKPSKGGEAVVKGESGAHYIALDTDLDDPLTYTAEQAREAVAIVAAEMTATVNASVPDLKDVPQAALCVIGTASATNWVGLVGNGNGGTNWVTFPTPVPVAGRTYSVRIEFDQRQDQRKIRYRVGDAVLGNDDGWYPNPKTTAANIQSVSFSGTGDISGLGGSNVVANVATFNGIGYTTFADALVAAKAADTGWSDSNPIKLFKNAEYTASKTETLYVNPNGKTFTISGKVVTKTSGNTYTVTAQDDCEAKIDTTYYVTFDEAVTAAGASDVIVVNKSLTKDLTVAKSYSLNPNGKLRCAALTVNVGQTLTLADGLDVTTATINGAVAGETLTVNGTLTGVNVAKLTFGNTATFAYGDTALAPTALTLPASGTVTITGIESLANGAPIITATGLDAAKFTGAPAGRTFKVEDGILTLAPGATITKADETEGFDYTNGTVSVTASVESGKTGTATLKVVDFATGNVITAYDAKTIGSDDLTWQLADELDGGRLTPGGTYSYVVEVKVDDVVVATKAGTFTAAKWPSDIWFGADASKSANERELNGSWESTKKPAVVGNAYVIEEDALFNVSDAVVDKGTNHVTRVDAVVTFESLIDEDSLETESDALGGFVAAKSGDISQWMALTSNGAQPWVALTGALAPEANVQYIVRAEIDFQSVSKRVRYLVSTDGSDFAPLALENGAQWLALADSTKETLAKVELKGAGSLAKFEARVADKAIARVDDTEYGSMEDALEAVKDNGKAITLLTNATIEPDPSKPGKYEIAPNNHQYVSGGKVSDTARTIIVDGSGNPPVVRPTDTEMKKVMTPDGNSYKSYDSLRKFLERNKVEGYTKNDANAESVRAAMNAQDEANKLQLWQDYALGIDVGTSVAPVTKPAGDTDPNNITLAIPAVMAATPSDDYNISYEVVEGTETKKTSTMAGEIKIPLDTGTYSIKAVFKPKN